MKPVFLLLPALLLCLPHTLKAQAVSAADLALERKANDERYNRLNDTVRNVLETQELILQRQTKIEQRISSLLDEIEKLREQASRGNSNLVTRDELKKYVDKLKEIDEKRASDRELILEKIKDLAKMPLSLPPEPKEPKPSSASPNLDNVVEYTVKDGNTLMAIIAAYNADNKQDGLPLLTLEQVKKANPNLNPNRLAPGQVILIPVPARKLESSRH